MTFDSGYYILNLIQMDIELNHFTMWKIMNHVHISRNVCLRFIPVQIAGEAIKTIVHDCHIVDECLKAVLCHMIDWLAWPAASDLDKWVITFFHELTATKKLHTLVAVIEAKAEQVTEIFGQ